MHWMVDHYSVSVRRACGYGLFSRAAWYRKSRAPDQAALRRRIREIAHSRPRFGYLRIHVMLRREGWRINRKRVSRPCKLRMRMRRRKHMCLHRGVVPKATHPHQRLSMDFVHDQLFDARPFRILTVIDQWSREAVIVEPRFRFRGSGVADLLDRWVAAHGAPETITVDHGTEFTSKALEAWREARFYASRQTHGKRTHRELQRPPPRRVPERESVPFTGSRQAASRRMASGLQSLPTSRIPRVSFTRRIRGTASPKPDPDMYLISRNEWSPNGGNANARKLHYSTVSF